MLFDLEDFWSFDNTLDSATGRHNFGAQNGPVYATGLIGDCLEFGNGLGGTLAPEDWPPEQPSSIQIWALDPGEDDDVGGGLSAAGSNWDLFVFQDLTYFIRARHGSVDLVGPGLVQGIWNQFVLTWDGVGNLLLYHNGVFAQAFTSSYFGPVGPLGYSWVPNSNPTGLTLCGLWRRALSAGDVVALYNLGSGFNPTIPIT